MTFYCTRCRKPVEAELETFHVQGDEYVREEVCPHCGRKLFLEMDVCPICGELKVKSSPACDNCAPEIMLRVKSLIKEIEPNPTADTWEAVGGCFDKAREYWERGYI